MPDYLDFNKESFYDSLSQTEFLVPFIVIVALVAFIMVIFGTASNGPSAYLGVFLIIGLAAGMMIGQNNFESSHPSDLKVATHNVEQKYNTDKISFGTFDEGSRNLRATYSDKETGISKDISFAFVKDDKEPFLVKPDTSDDSLKKIENSITKSK